MKIVRAIFYIIPIFTASCANAPSNNTPAKSALIGAWYGNAMVVGDGAPGDNVDVRNADGSFVTYFRVCDEYGNVSDVIVETGQWDYTDGIVTTETLSANGKLVISSDDYYRETYRVAGLPNHKLSLTSLKSYGSTAHPEFVETRIDTSAFHLPVEPCSSTARPTTK